MKSKIMPTAYLLILLLLSIGLHLVYPIKKIIPMYDENDSSNSALGKAVGRSIINFTEVLTELKPDMLLILGDRYEPLVAAIASSTLKIPIAHIHGGDISIGGHADDSVRHAITKFAHIHLPATEQSAERIIRMGEEEWRVHVVGSPVLDIILNETLLPAEALSEKLGLDLSRPLILLVQHPVTTQANEAAEQMRETLEAIVEIGNPTVLLYPNSDTGGRRMIEVIKEYEKQTFIKTFKSLPRREYLSMMKAAGVMVGNSSSGIIEAPSFGLPVVNIGIRQEGRERGHNIIDVNHNKPEIIKAVEKAITDKEFLTEVKKCQSPYGDGKAAPRITEILNKVEITPQLLQKKITY